MRTFILFIICASLSQISFAQELAGKLITTNGEPVIGGYICSPDQKTYCLTDHNGHFTCQGFTVNDTVTISHIGLKTIRLVVTNELLNNDQKIIMEDDYFSLDQVHISNQPQSSYITSKIDLILNPVSNSQQVLRTIPGLFIGQHAGGGKAEQIFLRGFDIDHGTDIKLSVDGMPVNMVSHAHGQGYSDLHFIIPETIENIDFGKGPYYADQGNFNTAGFVNFKTKDKLKESKFGIEYGRFNTGRVFGLFDIFQNPDSKQNAYIASEYLLSDGPFISPQDFNRFNVMGKYIRDFDNDDKLSIQFSRFQSTWNASGQIPQRLVDSGELDRFGAVDDTEGGTTNRTNAAINYTKNLNENTFLRMNSYYVNYNFELFSNFTFFLFDEENGDQIQQLESRNIYGLESVLFNSKSLKSFDLESNLGVGFRLDDINDNQLSYTINRTDINQRLAFGDIDELNLYAFADTKIEKGKFLINPSLRFDYFKNTYLDKLSTNSNAQSSNSAILTPNLNLIFNPNNKWHLFFKSGFGYHTNDTRVVVARSTDEVLPYAFGNDLGFIWKPNNRIFISSALWQLYLQQEFVYVGDAAIVEPSGETQRYGLEFGLKVQLSKYLFFDTDFTKTIAKSINDVEGENNIPLAPDVTASGGISYNAPNGFAGGLRYRYIKDRPANEDYSIVAEGYFLADANLSYRLNSITLGVRVENIFNTEWNEAQFATESRLRNESTPVEELHFTPGAPFTLSGRVSYSF